MQGSLYKTVRTDLATRIARGNLKPGDRLPAERELAERFGVARSVIRQALAGLARDGMIVSAYPRGYHVLGPRIPSLSRLRLLVDEPWEVDILDVAEQPATEQEIDLFGLDPGDHTVLGPFELRGAHSHEPWALGLATYPLDTFNDATRALLRSTGFIDDDQLERVSGRRIVGYHERVRACLPSLDEGDRLAVAATEPILAMTRTARTTTSPIAQLSIAARIDRFEVDYLIEA
jgi:GntR family transcriptional regulator